MKSTRRVFAVMLALVMVFSLTMASAVFADGNGTDKPKDKVADTEKEKKDTEESSKEKKEPSVKDQLLEQKKALKQQLVEARKSGKVELAVQLVQEVKAFKEQMKAAVRSAYTGEELQALEQVGETLENSDAALTIIPVENIIAKGKNLKFDTPPVVKSGRILVPVRALSEAYGADVQYDPAAHKVTISKGDVVIVLQLDSRTVSVNGVETQIDVPAQSLNSRTVVPLRFIVEKLGLKIEYDQEDGTVEIEEEDDGEAEQGTGSTSDSGTTGTSTTDSSTETTGSGTSQDSADTTTTGESN